MKDDGSVQWVMTNDVPPKLAEELYLEFKQKRGKENKDE